jgi:hypothetical protein
MRQRSPSSSDNNLVKRLRVVDDSAARIPRPSDLSQPKYYLKLNPSRFALHRPPDHNSIPLTLLHPIFAEFVTDVETHEPTPQDNALVGELRAAMSQPCEDEVVQSYEFRRILAEHYKIQLYSAEIGSTGRITKGHACVGRFIYVVFDMKGWIGKRDPEVQASANHLEALRPSLQEGQDPLDVLPCIIVYCVGGCPSLTCYRLLTPHRHANWVFWDGSH